MRGRKPVPAALNVLRGNPGKRAVPTDRPKVPTARPEIPDHLSPAARAEWDRIVPDLEGAGLLTNIDRAALAAYCTAYARWAEAEESVKTLGVLVKSPNGYPMVSPYLVVANKAMEQMTRLLVEFGMSPSSRARVTALPPKEEDPFDRFDGRLKMVKGGKGND